MKRILMVDDNAEICRIVKKQLEAKGGFEVSVCTKSTEAFEAIKTWQPHLILLDVSMQGLSGPEIVEQLKGNPDTSDIPFVYLTGSVDQYDIAEQKRITHGNLIVAKPFKAAELIRVINLALES